MADIAMLVAEEYERRIKNSRKNGEESMELLSCVGILGSSSFSWMKERVNMIMKKEKMGEILGKVMTLDPKSQMSRAASNGFFSA